MDKEAKYVYIPDENGNDVKFEVIIYFEIEKLKGQYIIATPAFEETDEAYAFKIFKEDDGSEIFLALEDDDDEFEMVLETYNTLMSEDGLFEE
ncbi:MULTISPECIES: DUF1292 domain-containing protein [Clostridium]|uniref:UPF0473 protein CLP_2733 n=2 Tax=Clostridium butyricum TaxID=1492 RepID=C4IHK2_CLOBU|nr:MULTISPECIES: DUF1292 domain-containing protein [Clostridium]APF22269.1 hypothetical protein NPD4_1448 [Clostridium butyricum]EDT74848.1 conserved hypothetical protein [Clostridium butyricum 5521]EEP54366.1 conserved hypothetical protein [Clostridium butyricum E4 str. BoNT E BL5262]EMU54222.1 hypothetical protein CBDKU1_20060 [Clostridium butyricum DKU-01]ENZ35932.1 hypothetical protein HMPREF1084_00515 [Clostridium butyricum 60E.3]